MTAEPHKDALPGIPDLRVLEELDGIIADRLAHPREGSYVTSLVSDSKGIDKVLEKVGEEATEFIIAVKNGTPARTVEEAADLQFPPHGSHQARRNRPVRSTRRTETSPEISSLCKVRTFQRFFPRIRTACTRAPELFCIHHPWRKDCKSINAGICSGFNPDSSITARSRKIGELHRNAMAIPSLGLQSTISSWLFLQRTRFA